MTEHTRTARVLVSHTDDALDVARTKLEHLATRDGYRITSEPRIIGAQQHAGAELIGTTPQGDPVAANQDGAGTGHDLTAALVPGSIRFTTS